MAAVAAAVLRVQVLGRVVAAAVLRFQVREQMAAAAVLQVQVREQVLAVAVVQFQVREQVVAAAVLRREEKASQQWHQAAAEVLVCLLAAARCPAGVRPAPGWRAQRGGLPLLCLRGRPTGGTPAWETTV